MSDSPESGSNRRSSLTPYLVVRNASEAIEFYKKAFNAEEMFRMPMPDGAIMHAEVRFGDSLVYLCDEFPEHGAKSPLAFEGTPVSLHMYVANADAAFDQAVAAGAKVLMPLTNMFWGDRYGRLSDPYGHVWAIAQRVEDVSPEEMDRRAQAAFGGSC